MISLDAADLRAQLRSFDRFTQRDLSKDLRGVFGRLSSEAAAAAKNLASTRLERRAARTLRPASSAVGAAMWFGGGFPGAFGAEFGAGRNQRRVVNHFGYYVGWNQFDYWTGNGADAGNFVYPGIRAAVVALRDEIATEVEALLVGAKESA